jgi:hypothetical protein
MIRAEIRPHVLAAERRHVDGIEPGIEEIDVDPLDVREGPQNPEGVPLHLGIGLSVLLLVEPELVVDDNRRGREEGQLVDEPIVGTNHREPDLAPDGGVLRDDLGPDVPAHGDEMDFILLQQRVVPRLDGGVHDLPASRERMLLPGLILLVRRG